MELDKESKTWLALTIIFVIVSITVFLLLGLEFVVIPVVLTAVSFISFIFTMDFVSFEDEPTNQDQEEEE